MYNRLYGVNELDMDILADTRDVYRRADVLQKGELVKLMFDSNLYYQGIYRTPTMMNIYFITI